MANIHGITAQKDDFVSYWDHIATLHKDSMLFYNFQYQPQEDQDELVSGMQWNLRIMDTILLSFVERWSSFGGYFLYISTSDHPLSRAFSECPLLHK